jgi:hypothetical protein
VVRASSSVDVRSSSVLVAPAVIRRVLALRLGLPASLQAAGPCIRPARLRPALPADVLALASVLVARAAVPALVLVPAALLGPAADFCLQAKHRVLSVRVVRHAAVDASSTQRPRKAR